MGSGYAGVYESRKGRKQAESQADDARAREEARQAQIDANIRRVRTMYGADTSTQEGKDSKLKIDQWLDDYSNTVNEANTVDLDNQFTSTVTNNRWDLADRGLLGGSVDAGVQRDQLSQLIAGRQKIVAAARDARRGAESTLNQNRLNLEGQIAAGNQLNPDFSALTEQVQMGLDTAKSQIIPNAVGNTFTQVGSGVGRTIASQGGRSTTPTPSSSRPSSAGTIN